MEGLKLPNLEVGEFLLMGLLIGTIWYSLTLHICVYWVVLEFSLSSQC